MFESFLNKKLPYCFLNKMYRARPEMAATSYILMTTFPNRELTNELSTLSESGLLNAVIVQRNK